jgi:hypothetical protein
MRERTALDLWVILCTESVPLTTRIRQQRSTKAERPQGRLKTSTHGQTIPPLQTCESAVPFVSMSRGGRRGSRIWYAEEARPIEGACGVTSALIGMRLSGAARTSMRILVVLLLGLNCSRGALNA